MANCLVVGANGQDGSYLCEILLEQGHSVCGIGRQIEAKYIKGIANFTYKQCDIRDLESLGAILEEVQPVEIYHVAAIHGAYGFNYEEKWNDVIDVNIKSLQKILEFSKQRIDPPSIFYASSAKVFGETLPRHVSIKNNLKTDCLYSISKVTAENLLTYYNKKYNINVCIGYLFNHESPRREPEYFIPRVVNILKKSIEDPTYKETIYTLDFYCDWGCAREYMQMATDLIRFPNLNKCIFATGNQILARDLVRWLFNKYELDYKNHILIKHRDDKPERSTIDIKHTEDVLRYTPSRTIYDVCIDILNH